MIKLKETSRLGRKLKDRTGSTTVGSPDETPNSSHDVGDNGGPRTYASYLFSRPRYVDPSVVSFLGEDPRERDWPSSKACSTED